MQTDELVTPTDRFFTRSHAPIPSRGTRDLAARNRRTGGSQCPLHARGAEPRFPRREVTATLVCAASAGSEFLTLGTIAGRAAVGSGAGQHGPVDRHRAWRCAAQAVEGLTPGENVEMTGLDRVERYGHEFGFGGSIDLTKALSDEVLLATELNGAPLPPAHGFPLRAVVPGWIGARSVKWLGRITLREEPSSNYFQSKAYRVQRKINPNDPRDVSGGVALSEVPLNVVIVEPSPKQVVTAGPVRVRGWALGSGGHALTAIEVSAGNEQEWIRAGTVAKASDWSWTLWEATVELPKGRHTLVARATDCTGATQPAMLSATWNVKGYNNNAWHRVTVRAV